MCIRLVRRAVSGKGAEKIAPWQKISKPEGGRGPILPAVLVILVALALAIFGFVQIGRTLTPGQRVVLGVVFVLGIGCLVLWLINAGVLGRVTEG